MDPCTARARFAWALFDWANSPYTTLIVTFVFPAYFASAVVGDAVAGQAMWGVAMGISGLLVAVTGPVMGALADVSGRRKPWLGALVMLCVAGSTALWWVVPSPAAVPLAVALVAVSNLGYEGANVFYNAMLPEVSDESRMGRLSGWAWGLGYAGGLAALVLALYGLVLPEAPWLGIPKDEAMNVRAIGPLVALWLLAFSAPLFLWVPERGRALPGGAGFGRAMRSLGRSLREVAALGPVGRFLIAHMLYADGLVTLFAMGGVYVSGAWGFTLEEVLLFGILLNVTAGLGAAAFGWMDDLVGWKPTVLASLGGLIAAGTAILVVEERDWVWALGAALGLFVGPAQAASRSGMARLAPPERRTELFGLYALAGKATAFAGPWLVGVVTALSGSQRLGMGVVIVFFALGALGLTTVRAPDRGS